MAMAMTMTTTTTMTITDYGLDEGCTPVWGHITLLGIRPGYMCNFKGYCNWEQQESQARFNHLVEAGPSRKHDAHFSLLLLLLRRRRRRHRCRRC